MNLMLLPRHKRLFFLLKRKGPKYLYNYIYFNLFWSRRHPFLTKLLNWFEPYPHYIEVEVTTRCNLRCIICERTYWDEPNRDMSYEQFTGIIDQFPKLKWIGLTGIGESFMNRDFMKMLRYVKDRNAMVELYDTFYFIDEQNAQELIEMEIDTIFVSLDAATKETYESIRVGSNFERVVGNVKNLIRLKKEMNADFPQLYFHFIVNRLNYKEMPQYIDLVKSLSGEETHIIQFTRMLHEFDQTKELFIEIDDEILQETERKAREAGIPVVWSLNVPRPEDKKPISQCVEWTQPFIFVTGHVIPCCSGNEAGRREHQKATALGNIFEKSFREIWFGEKYKNLRKMLKRGKVPPVCANCCLYNVTPSVCMSLSEPSHGKS